MRPCTAFQQKIAKIGPSSNEGLKYRDIESVKFEHGKCCAHFFRGSIYILEPVCYEAEIGADSIIWELFANKSAECLNLRNSFITISSVQVFGSAWFEIS